MTVGPHGPHGPHGGLHAITPPRNGPHACQIPNRNAVASQPAAAPLPLPSMQGPLCDTTP